MNGEIAQVALDLILLVVPEILNLRVDLPLCIRSGVSQRLQIPDLLVGSHVITSFQVSAVDRTHA